GRSRQSATARKRTHRISKTPRDLAPPLGKTSPACFARIERKRDAKAGPVGKTFKNNDSDGRTTSGDPGKWTPPIQRFEVEEENRAVRPTMGTEPSSPRSRYTRAMRSVADELRQRDPEAGKAFSIEERLGLAFALRDEGVAAFCAARGISREEGIRLLQRRRQAGRTPSKCMSDLIG